MVEPGLGRGATLTKTASVTPVVPVCRRAARMDHVSMCKGQRVGVSVHELGGGRGEVSEEQSGRAL